MQAKPHCLVIGRGIIGLATALELYQQGFCITIIGPEEDSSSGSQAAMGLASVKAQIKPEKPLFAFKLYGFENLLSWVRGIEKLSQRPIPYLQGATEPYGDVEKYQSIRRRVFHGKPTGMQPLTTLAAQDFAKMAPLLFDLNRGTDLELLGSFFYSEDLWVDIAGLIMAMESLFKTNS